jgi:hypothetical protein
MPKKTIDIKGIHTKNPFWILEEDENEVVQEVAQVEVQEVQEVQEEVQEVQEEVQEVQEVQESSQIAQESVSEKSEEIQYRTWNKGTDEGRFLSEELKKNIFSSPFSKKKVWLRPRFREDDDNWVSIRWNQPQFEEEVEPSSVVYEERGDFPSMLTRSTRNICVEETITPQTELSAVAWAERIKKSLERAEAARMVKKEEKGVHLSFFRTVF